LEARALIFRTVDEVLDVLPLALLKIAVNRSFLIAACSPAPELCPLQVCRGLRRMNKARQFKTRLIRQYPRYLAGEFWILAHAFAGNVAPALAKVLVQGRQIFLFVSDGDQANAAHLVL